ncbi:hypothetical protein DHEL01_v209499 [Diaporthe helianthi]|uniref:Uncharacterized protein n=1 Tax=Diaporthe helianthi TaxID=158607 RepID=A0A2P5HPB5_DIAHE|nr:hypothetical protein DHEL01_v209499 [Diaporthe helianthi]
MAVGKKCYIGPHVESPVEAAQERKQSGTLGDTVPVGKSPPERVIFATRCEEEMKQKEEGGMPSTRKDIRPAGRHTTFRAIAPADIGNAPFNGRSTVLADLNQDGSGAFALNEVHMRASFNACCCCGTSPAQMPVSEAWQWESGLGIWQARKHARQAYGWARPGIAGYVNKVGYIGLESVFFGELACLAKTV